MLCLTEINEIMNPHLGKCIIPTRLFFTSNNPTNKTSHHTRPLQQPKCQIKTTNSQRKQPDSPNSTRSTPRHRNCQSSPSKDDGKKKKRRTNRGSEAEIGICPRRPAIDFSRSFGCRVHARERGRPIPFISRPVAEVQRR